jgi:predicted dehydrogenase
MASEKLRVGIIGVGLFAVYAHIPQLQATGRAEVVAICRRHAERLTLAQQTLQVAEAYTDWQQMLAQSNLDAVVVSTPHNAHVEPTLAALARGLHVLVDKPMALSSREAWAMVDAAQQANKILMVAYNNRTEGQWRTFKQQIQAGAIGRVRQINCAVSAYRRWFWETQATPPDILALARQLTGMPDEFFADWQDWHADPAQMGGGAFVDIGIHWLDILLWLAGAPAVAVVAFTENAGLPVESLINVQARLANDVLLSMTFADAVPQGILSSDEQLMIVGEEGVLTADAEGAIWLSRDNQRRKLEAVAPAPPLAAAFVEAILDGKENPSPAQEGAHTVEFVEALYRSAAEGRIVRIESH